MLKRLIIVTNSQHVYRIYSSLLLYSFFQLSVLVLDHATLLFWFTIRLLLTLSTKHHIDTVRDKLVIVVTRPQNWFWMTDHCPLWKMKNSVVWKSGLFIWNLTVNLMKSMRPTARLPNVVKYRKYICNTPNQSMSLLWCVQEHSFMSVGCSHRIKNPISTVYANMYCPTCLSRMLHCTMFWLK